MTQTAPTKAQRAKAQMLARRVREQKAPAYDFVEVTLKGEFARYAGHVEHYAEMERIAGTESEKNKWRFLRRIAQKMKDDILAILNRYLEHRNLHDLARAVQEAQEERLSLIKWLGDRGQEGRGHIYRAADEIDAFQELLTDILHHLKYNNPRRRIASEAAYVLATLPR